MSRVVRCLIVACLVLGSVASVRAQTWARTYDGSDGESPLALGEGPAGEILVAAWTDSFGTATADAWLLELDADGELVREGAFGEPERGGADGAVIASDGGALFVGRNVVDIFLKQDAWALRVDAAGDIQWGTLLAWVGFGRTFLADASEGALGGWFVAGTSAMNDFPPQNVLLSRINDFGNVQWQQEHGSGAADTPRSIVGTPDDGVILAGSTTFGGNEDVLLVKYNSIGLISWQVQLGGPESDQAEEVIVLRDGGYAVAGVTQSFTASGRAPFIMRFDAAGTLLWHRVFGDSEWGDFQAVTETSDGDLVALGRISEAGFPTNDLWAVKMTEDDGTVLWQRAYEGSSGDYADTITELSDGSLLMGATWGWGFPEESIWLLRTLADGTLPDCDFVRDTMLLPGSPRITPVGGPLALRSPQASSIPQAFTDETTRATVRDRCGVAGCPPLSCDDLLIERGPACEELLYTLTAFVSGGEPPLEIEWDLDGDTVADAFGSPVQVMMDEGMPTVALTVRDACISPAQQECMLILPVVVDGPTPPPAEVSDVRGGDPPLQVLDAGELLVFEEEPSALAFSLHLGSIGDWYGPGGVGGTDCHRLDAVSRGDGTASLTVSLPAGSWVLATAADTCFEGPAGDDSFGVARSAAPTWQACGPLP